MEILIEEVRQCFGQGLLMPAMIGLFTIPDAAAAVEYGAIAPRKRYPQWIDAYVRPCNGRLTGELAWAIRNALMHETAMNWRGKGFSFDRVMFTLPTNVTVNMDMSEIGGTADIVRQFDLKDVVQTMLNAAANWCKVARQNDEKSKAMDGLMQVRPQGLDPWIIGHPIIA